MLDEQIVAWATMATSALMLLGGILVKFNHKRIRSNCCSKELEMSVDVEDTTPKKDETLSIGLPK